MMKSCAMQSEVQQHAPLAPVTHMALPVWPQCTRHSPTGPCSGRMGVQVFILGRMGNAREALQLIIDQLGDIPQVCDALQCSCVQLRCHGRR